MSFTNHEISKTNNTNTWLTPPEVLHPLGPFDLDPCAAPEPRPIDTARTMWAEASVDGLSRDWFGRVWLNPPYGRFIGQWMARLASHGNGMALVYARTDTAWFQNHVFPHVTGMFFFKGRLRFLRPDGSVADAATAPHVLLAYGEHNARMLSQYPLPGVYLPAESQEMLREATRRVLQDFGLKVQSKVGGFKIELAKSEAQ